jgi:hypothetical protein
MIAVIIALILLAAALFDKHGRYRVPLVHPGGFKIYLGYGDKEITKQQILQMAADYQWMLEWVRIEKMSNEKN